jgi:DNA modification methylase
VGGPLPEWVNKIVGYDEVDPASLLAHPSNFRRHPAKQREALRGSLNELDIIAPVLVNRLTGHVLDGHARIEEYLTAGIALVPVAYVEVPPEKEALALLSLDPIAAMAEADKDALDSLLREASTGETGLQQMMTDLAASTGLFFDAEPKAEDPGAQIDKANELREKWGTERGQIWEVGKHRVMCGDSTSAEDVDCLLGGTALLLMVTDPPYGVSYADKNAMLNEVSPGNRIQTPIENDHLDLDAAEKLWAAAFTQACLHAEPGAAYYSFSAAGAFQTRLAAALATAGWLVKHQLVWVKNNHVLGRCDYNYKHEPIWYGWKDGGHHFYGPFSTSVLEYNKPQASTQHPTTKPTELIARLVENSSLVGEAVYDPFLGSGTTAVAAEQLNRICYGMEIEPKYVAVTLERLAGMGLEPKLL